MHANLSLPCFVPNIVCYKNICSLLIIVRVVVIPVVIIVIVVVMVVVDIVVAMIAVTVPPVPLVPCGKLSKSPLSDRIIQNKQLSHLW